MARIYLGTRRGDDTTYIAIFDDEENAAIAYDRVARKVFGARALLNFPDRPLKPATIEDMRDWALRVNYRHR